MPTFTVLIGWLAGVLTFSAYLPYFISTIRGKTKPNRATWWILVVVGMMLAGGYYSLGAKDTIWVPVGYVVGPIIIAILSLWFGEGGWSRFDRVCLAGAAVAGFLWWLFDAPFTALMINLVMDWLGLMPTVHKAYNRPYTEDQLSWMCWFIGSLINLFAVGHWTVELAVYPVYMVVGNGIIAALVCWPRQKKTS